MSTNTFPPDELAAIGEKFAMECRDRMSVLKLTGARRDEACLNYYIGGAMALKLSGEGRMADVIGLQAVHLVALHGYDAVTRIIDGV